MVAEGVVEEFEVVVLVQAEEEAVQGELEQTHQPAQAEMVEILLFRVLHKGIA